MKKIRVFIRMLTAMARLDNLSLRSHFRSNEDPKDPL